MSFDATDSLIHSVRELYSNFEKIGNTSISPPPEPRPRKLNASAQYNILKKRIQEFQDSLDEEHEIAFYLTSFGNSDVMYVTQIEYEDDVLLVFRGYIGDTPSVLIQHISQINFLLQAVKRADPEKPKIKIGFTPET